MNLSKLWGIVKDGKPGTLRFMELQRVKHDLMTEQQQQLYNEHKYVKVNTIYLINIYFIYKDCFKFYNS